MFPGGNTSKIWSYYGSVLTGDPTGDETNVQEPTVIFESATYKMWAKGGWVTPHLNYYTSSDGISWTPSGSNPLVTNVEHPFVFKNGSTYYLYYVPSGTKTRFDLRTSADGISWSGATTGTMSVGAGGAWDDGEMGNIFVWIEGANDWRTIYEARQSGGAWHLGYATSSDGITWSKSGSNPVVNETGTTGGPFIYKDAASTYWLWAHRTVSGVLPTDISRYSSPNLTSWTRNPPNNTLTRLAASGNASANGQVADITMLTVGTQTYAWVVGNPDGSNSGGHAFIGLFIARLPIEQLIYTNEGY